MNKIFIFTLIFISSLTLSSCIQTDQTKTPVVDSVVEVKNEVDNKIDQKVTEEKTKSATDEGLLDELMMDDTSIDADLKALEADLQ